MRTCHHRHTGADHLSAREEFALYVATRWSSEPGVGQLVLVILQLGINLPFAIHGTVVVVVGRGSFLVELDDAVGLSRNLGVLGLGGTQLHLIVRWVHNRHQLSCTDILAFLHADSLDATAHLERQVHFISGLYPPGILQGGTLANGS